MARALREQSGRALKRDTKGATVGCTDCCGPAPVLTYFQACPCFAYQQQSCAVPDDPCIYIDTRAELSDGSALSDVVYTEQVIVNVDGLCYTVTQTLWSDDPNLTGVNVIPDGAFRITGDGVIVQRNPDCVEGCAETNVGPEYFELFRCDGCPTDSRAFGCAKDLVGLTVVVLQSTPSHAGPDVLGWCVDRSVGYTQAQAESLGLIYPVAPLLIWKYGPGHPVAVPADSCCYSSAFGNCTGLNCLHGMNWTGFGNDDRWFPLDTCCGTQQGLRYSVALSYVRTIVASGADPVTTTITATVTRTDPRDGGGSNVTLQIAIRGQRPSTGFDVTTTSEAVVSLEPSCCLPYSGLVPMLDRVIDPVGIGQPQIPVEGEPGYYYWSKIANVLGGDGADQRRAGWNITPWAAALRLSERDETDGTYTSSGSAFGTCGVWNFIHNESTVYNVGGSDSTQVNLRVSVLPDQDFPCAYAGGCGAHGWGGDLGSILP